MQFGRAVPRNRPKRTRRSSKSLKMNRFADRRAKKSLKKDTAVLEIGGGARIRTENYVILAI